MIEDRAIVLREFGGPDRLVVEAIEVGEPGFDELVVRQTAIGVNFHDIYVRSGQYRTLALPGIPGIEAVGIVEAIGSGVTDWSVGDRLAYVTRAYGGYTTARLLSASLALRVPESIDDQTAAALMLRGLTVEMLLTQVQTSSAKQTILVHAAAGGVGRLLVQAAAGFGARVLATVGSEEKAKIALEAGADEVILYRDEDFVSRVESITAGEGVDTVFDSVGADTFAGSINVLKRCGHLILFGQSSGPVATIDIPALAAKSLTFSRPILFDYLDDPARAAGMARGLNAALESGRLTPPKVTALPLAQASEAHRMLESRLKHDAVVLIP